MPDITVDKFLLFMFAVVPGVIAIQTYSLKCPGQKREIGTSITEAMVYSAINLILWWWWVHPYITKPPASIDQTYLTFTLFVVCIVSPVALALGWYKLRTTNFFHHRLALDHPIPRAWEHFVKNHRQCWYLFHLKKGGMVGGYFAENSYASTYPQDQEVYVEHVWRVDENGEFLEKVEGTLGCLIRLAECERVEFFDVDMEEDKDGKQRQGDAGAPEQSDPDPAKRIGGSGGAIENGQVALQQGNPPEGRVGDGTS